MPAMTRKRPILSEQIRQAMKRSGATAYAIGKLTGIDNASLSRFMAGTVGLTMRNLEKLAAVLHLKIVSNGTRPNIPQRRRGRPRKAR